MGERGGKRKRREKGRPDSGYHHQSELAFQVASMNIYAK